MKLLFAALSSVSALSSATVTPSRYGRSGCESTLDLIYQFPNNGSWLENIAVRPNGLVLGTRNDVPDLYSIDPKKHTASLVRTFASPITSLLGITTLKKDFYAVVGINETAGFAGEKSTGYIITADFTKTSPTFKRAAAIKGSLLLNGAAAFSSSVVLVTDSGNGVIYHVDISNGAVSIAASDAVLSPPNAGAFPSVSGLGINGIKIHDGYAYFTASTRGAYGRIPLSSYGKASGPAQVLATTGTFLDDLVVSRTGVAYAATNSNDTVLQITPRGGVETIGGKYNTLTLAGSTALAFVPGERERKLYVSTAGAQNNPVNGVTIEPAKLVKLTLGEDCY